MLVYVAEKRDFMSHVRNNQITDIVANNMKLKLRRRVGMSEY
jgi:hypothetical protein